MNSFSADDDPERPNYQILYFDNPDIPTEQFSTVIGDAVQNLRASLDHLVYELGVANSKNGKLSAKLTGESKFPVTTSPKAFWCTDPERLRAIRPEARTAIERLQPYNPSEFFACRDFRDHPLYRLNRLANIDKHHTLVVVNAAVGSWIVSGPSETVDAICLELEFFTGRLPKGRTVVARGIPNFPLKGEVNMRLQSPLYVAFEKSYWPDPDTGPAAVDGTLTGISNFIEGVVFPALDPFL